MLVREGVSVRLLLGVGVLLFVIVRVKDGDLVTDLLLLGVGVILRVIVRLRDGDAVTDLLLLGVGVVLRVIVRLIEAEAVSDRDTVGVCVVVRVFVAVPDGLAAIVRVTEGERVSDLVALAERLTDLLLVGVREFEKNDGSLIGILGKAVVGSSVGSFIIDGSSVSGSLMFTEGSSVTRRSGIDGNSVFGSSVFGNAVFGTSIGGRLGYSVAGRSTDGIARNDGSAGRLVAIVGNS